MNNCVETVSFPISQGEKLMISRLRLPRRMLVACLCAVAALATAANSQAGSLAPGGSLKVVADNTAANNSSVANLTSGYTVVQDTGYKGFSYPSTGGGFYRSVVLQETATNKLTFLYQVYVTGRDVQFVNLSDIQGAIGIDARAATPTDQNGSLPGGGLPFGGFLSSSPLSQGDDIKRTPTFAGLGTVSFDFDNPIVAAPAATSVLILQTDATNYKVGFMGIADGATVNVNVYMPFIGSDDPGHILEAPEPTSMSLLGVGLVGMAGYGLRRWRRKANA
jgi:hypothetical protein